MLAWLSLGLLPVPGQSSLLCELLRGHMRQVQITRFLLHFMGDIGVVAGRLLRHCFQHPPLLCFCPLHGVGLSESLRQG